jgi:hypothetical protein
LASEIAHEPESGVPGAVVLADALTFPIADQACRALAPEP